MGLRQRTVAELGRESYAAARELLAVAHLPRAWLLLQEGGAPGSPQGARPYTEPALAALETAHRLDPEDLGIVHHLAIARHARAWDWELASDPRAAQEWEAALSLWNKLADAGEFWTGLRNRLQACRADRKQKTQTPLADADLAVLAEARQNLLKDLVEVHLDFVRHYCEANAPARAASHVQIIKRARIRPAARKEFVADIFKSMTSSVPEARSKRAFDSALSVVEGFLELFPDYLLALRTHAEVCREWISGLSYQDQWEQILCVSRRAEPYARRLAAHPELEAEPLAKTALEELVFEVSLRCHQRGGSCLVASGQGPLEVAERDAAKASLELGLRFGRLSYRRSPPGAPLRQLFVDSVRGHVWVLREEIREVFAADLEPETVFSTVETRLALIVDGLEEAVAALPEDQELQRGLCQAREQLNEFRLRLSGHPAPGPAG
jgi:hypothetical protein